MWYFHATLGANQLYIFGNNYDADFKIFLLGDFGVQQPTCRKIASSHAVINITYNFGLQTQV